MEAYQLINKIAAKTISRSATTRRDEDNRTYYIEIEGHDVEIRTRVSNCLQVELYIGVDRTTWHVNTIDEKERTALFNLDEAYRGTESSKYDLRAEMAHDWLEAF